MPMPESYKRYHIINLIKLALEDGKITPEEYEFIEFKLTDLGFTEADFEKFYNEAIKSEDYVVYGGTRSIERMLTDLIYIMMADGKIDEKEYEIIVKFAEFMDVKKRYVDEIIELIKRYWERNQ